MKDLNENDIHKILSLLKGYNDAKLNLTYLNEADDDSSVYIDYLGNVHTKDFRDLIQNYLLNNIASYEEKINKITIEYAE